MLRLAVVVEQRRGKIDAQDAIQRRQHILHPGWIADNLLAAMVGGPDDLAGLQLAAGNPKESGFWPVIAPVRRLVADARRSAEFRPP